MITEENKILPSAVEYIVGIHMAGSGIVRVTSPNLAEANCLNKLKSPLREQYMDLPHAPGIHCEGSDNAVEVAKVS